MVTKMKFGRKLNLQAISNALPGSDYNPSRFPGLVIRVDEPSASFILFESGIAIITDIVSEAKAKKAFSEMEKIVKSVVS